LDLDYYKNIENVKRVCQKVNGIIGVHGEKLFVRIMYKMRKMF
jgi:hypothetical protein